MPDAPWEIICSKCKHKHKEKCDSYLSPLRKCDCNKFIPMTSDEWLEFISAVKKVLVFA